MLTNFDYYEMISKFDSLQSIHSTKLGKILEEQVTINTSLNLQNKLLEERISRLEYKAEEPSVSDGLDNIRESIDKAFHYLDQRLVQLFLT